MCPSLPLSGQCIPQIFSLRSESFSSRSRNLPHWRIICPSPSPSSSLPLSTDRNGEETSRRWGHKTRGSGRIGAAQKERALKMVNRAGWPGWVPSASPSFLRQRPRPRQCRRRVRFIAIIWTGNKIAARTSTSSPSRSLPPSPSLHPPKHG